jgi:Flp pilus assembly pilin Flp
MNTLNDLTIRMIARTDAFVTCLANEEEGSEVAQAAGVALVAAGLIGAMSGALPALKSAVQAAFQKLTGTLSF